MKHHIIVYAILLFGTLISSCEYEDPYERVSIDRIIDAIESGDSTFHEQNIIVEGYLNFRYSYAVCAAEYGCSRDLGVFPDTAKFIIDDGFCGYSLDMHVYSTEDKLGDGLRLAVDDWRKIDVQNRHRYQLDPMFEYCEFAHLNDFPILISGQLKYHHINVCYLEKQFRSCVISLDQRTIDIINDAVTCGHEVTRL